MIKLKKQYNELALKYNQLIKDYQLIFNENIKLKDQVKNLKKEINDLSDELAVLSQLPDTNLTFNQFKQFLKSPFTIKTMPKVGGIYAYYNEKDNLLYVGQSVNMGNRLIQHFRKGKIKINGHDSEFKNEDDWKFYVLEYIDRNDKRKLDDREAYWIAIAKTAFSDKKMIDVDASKKFEQMIKNNNLLQTNDIQLSETIKSKGQLTNRTRGNNVRM